MSSTRAAYARLTRKGGLMPRNASRHNIGAIRRLPSGGYQARVRDPLTDRLVSIGRFRSVADADKAIAAADEARCAASPGTVN